MPGDGHPRLRKTSCDGPHEDDDGGDDDRDADDEEEDDGCYFLLLLSSSSQLWLCFVDVLGPVAAMLA